MLDTLFLHISQKVQLSDREKALVSKFFTRRHFRKRQFLLEEGAICKSLFFIAKGLVKSYRLDEKGNENINLFGMEGWWVSDFSSFVKQQTATLYIDAIEDTDTLVLTKESYEELTQEIPLMDRYFRILYQNSLVTKDERLVGANRYTAEQKYQRLIDSEPILVQRVPQHLIASYLGLAPATLSRLRKRLALFKHI